MIYKENTDKAYDHKLKKFSAEIGKGRWNYALIINYADY